MIQISPHLRDVLRPLSDATAGLLKENKKLYDTDRLKIGLVETTGEHQKFEFTAYAVSHNGDDDISSRSWHTIHPSYEAVSSWWQRIPGATHRYQGGGCAAPATDITVLCTLAVWGRSKITFSSDEARMQFWVILGAFMRNQKVAEYQARFKELGEIPPQAPVGKADLPPMTHQRVAALCLIESDAYQLFMEMRTGKTYAVIMAMDDDADKNPSSMSLIICPKNVRTNWRNEIGLFSQKNVNVITLRGGKLRRMKLLLQAFENRKDYDYTVVLASYEGASKTKMQLCAFNWRWGILDESHYIKEPTTIRWRTMRELRACCAKRVALTGTPICNSAFDLYTQFEWLGDGCSGFSSYEGFRNFYGTFISKNGEGAKYEKILVGMRNLPLLQERITRSAFLISRKEALPNLPPVTHSMLEAEMSAHHSQVYKDVASKLYAEIENELNQDDVSAITVTNILTRLLRLAQISAGFVALDGEVDIDTGEVVSRIIDHFDPNPKIEELVTLLKGRDEASKTIVWSCFVPTIKTLRARLELEGIECVTFYGKTKDHERDENVWRFNNDPTVKVFLGNQSAGGVGINLNGACVENGVRRCQTDLVAYLCQGWSSPVRSQSAARPQDKTCDWPIEVLDICAVTNDGDQTIDYEILQRVLDKQAHAMKVQDIRSLLKRLI